MQATPPVHAAVVAVPGLQLPAPSQVAGVVVSWPPEQDDVPVQAVPAAASAQAAVPGEQSLSALLPPGRGLQTPLLPPVLLAMHDSQSPEQSLLQQTWSAL